MGRSWPRHGTYTRDFTLDEGGKCARRALEVVVSHHVAKLVRALELLARQRDPFADLAERFSADEVRVNYTQNLILPHVARADLPALRFMTSSTAPLSVDKHLEFEKTYGIPIVQLAPR